MFLGLWLLCRPFKFSGLVRLAFARLEVMASKYSVVATREVKATAGKVHDLLVNLGRTEEWNPYVEMDPAIKSEMSDQKIGVGAWYSYESKRVGNGRLEITHVAPTVITLEIKFFNKGKVDVGQTRYMISPGSSADSVTVTWEMTGEHAGIRKLMWPIMNGVLTKAFNRGLEKLAALVE
jgi:Polyketide cyclase / dehydrase and lipid transport